MLLLRCFGFGRKMQQRCGSRLDRLIRPEQRMVDTGLPVRRKIAVMLGARVARLPWQVDETAVVPFAHIHQQPHRRTGDGLEVASTVVGVIGGGAAAAKGHRRQRPAMRLGQPQPVERVHQIEAVQIAPAPCRGVVATIRGLLISGDGFWPQDIFDAA